MYNNCLSGRGAVRLACLHGVQEVEGSNPFAPTPKTLGKIPGFFDSYEKWELHRTDGLMFPHSRVSDHQLVSIIITVAVGVNLHRTHGL